MASEADIASEAVVTSVEDIGRTERYGGNGQSKIGMGGWRRGRGMLLHSSQIRESQRIWTERYRAGLDGSRQGRDGGDGRSANVGCGWEGRRGIGRPIGGSRYASAADGTIRWSLSVLH